MKTNLIVALDVPSASHIPPIVDQLPLEVQWFKVGLELFCRDGATSLQHLHDQERQIFLDLKLHDIPRTVANAVTSAASHGVDLMTVHACGGRAMLEAAAEAAGKFGPNRPQLIAVTVLTSLDQGDLNDLGIARSPSEQALAMAELALSSGIDGLVCSPHEAKALRDRFGPDPLLITPGIRLPSDDVGDQKRVATPSFAAAQGASYIVVGRTILGADDPRAAADTVLAELG